MARMKRREAILGYLFITLLMWIMGIGFLAYGRLEGIALVFVAIFFTIMIHPVRMGISEVFKAAVKIRRIARPPTDLVERIVYLLQEWKPVKRFGDESPAEAAASEYLSHHFPNRVKFQKYHEEFRSDLEIEDVGIEIKVLWKTAELTRMRGQMILYCKYFSRVVALIFNYNDISLDSFIRDMDTLYPNKVKVIIKK